MNGCCRFYLAWFEEVLLVVGRAFGTKESSACAQQLCLGAMAYRENGSIVYDFVNTVSSLGCLATWSRTVRSTVGAPLLHDDSLYDEQRLHAVAFAESFV